MNLIVADRNIPTRTMNAIKEASAARSRDVGDKVVGDNKR
jgi:hypothetical protein